MIQDPGVAYYIVNNPGSSTQLAFTGTPSVGTGNIAVIYRQFINASLGVSANSITAQSIAANTIQAYHLSSGLLNPIVNTFIGDNITTSFTLSQPALSANSCLVTVNGITQNYPVNYSVNGTTLTFTSAPATSSVIRCSQQSIISTGVVPIDGSITTSKYAANSIPTSAFVANTIPTNAHIPNSITANLIASVSNTSIVGLLQSGQIGSVSNTSIVGLLQSGQIGSVSNTSIVGTIVPNQLSTGALIWNSSGAVLANGSYGTTGQVLTSAGSAASPTWVNNPYQIQVYAWGGGAAGGGGGSSPNPAGGGGGAANGYINVNPSQTLIAFVGGGGGYRGAGAGRGTAAAGGGGLTGTAGYGGGGGGYSGIFANYVAQTTAIILAGGGGGGGWDSSAPSGGSGGGTSGLSGGSGNPGTGGGQYSAGVGGGGNGSQLLGGNADDGDGGGGGGGGGGYWGGGAGTNTNPGSGGGGGSGYLNPALVYNGTLTTGSGATPGDSGNSLRGSYGNGGNSGTDGTQGVTIIRYLGAQRGTGGTVTSSGGYTYHTFTTTGSNTYTA